MAKSPASKKSRSASPKSPKVEPASTTVPEVRTEPPVFEQLPLAAPPRPQLRDGDYFSSTHQPATSHLSLEPNPFEHSFGGGAETPGGTKLPSVAALTSPSLNIGTGLTPLWGNSLRTGPLSPAMLSGPTNDQDYFGNIHHRGAFSGITPNESSLRTGLTPGGGGSMFPAPSPNTQALFNSLASGGATPSTLDFHRTAMTAAAMKRNQEAVQPKSATQPHENGQDSKQLPSTNEMFAAHDANDAANGLYMLASQSRNGNGSVGSYAMAQQQPVHAHIPHNNQGPLPPPMPVDRNGNSMSTASGRSGRGMSEVSAASDDSEQKQSGRGKVKKGAANARRKADDTPTKVPPAKKQKVNPVLEPEPMSDDEQEPDLSKDEYNTDGKKMTDEEKRKNFLERNRVAALKCRQRKKQWLANLQQKCEIFSGENENLTNQINALREEVVNLKTLLLAHKECPVTQQQGLGGMQMNHLMGDYGPQMSNPYGMAMQSQQVMAGQGMGRRFS